MKNRPQPLSKTALRKLGVGTTVALVAAPHVRYRRSEDLSWAEVPRYGIEPRVLNTAELFLLGVNVIHTPREEPIMTSTDRDLIDSNSNEIIALATVEQAEASDAAGPEGHILIDGSGNVQHPSASGAKDFRSVYVGW